LKVHVVGVINDLNKTYVKEPGDLEDLSVADLDKILKHCVVSQRADAALHGNSTKIAVDPFMQDRYLQEYCEVNNVKDNKRVLCVHPGGSGAPTMCVSLKQHNAVLSNNVKVRGCDHTKNVNTSRRQGS
jgi:hypothetical protein